MSADGAVRNGFDKLARPYRWMEYLTFGPLLWRTRVAFLPSMQGARQALVLGDGDGRFSAALLGSNCTVRLHAVDVSGVMLRRLQQRAERQNDALRVRLLHADAVKALPQGRFDLICSHFFLDCLSEAQCKVLAAEGSKRAGLSACWVISEFDVPQGSLYWPAQILVRGLYAVFGMLTGLRVRRLPDYGAALRGAGWVCAAVETRLGGILRAEMWALRPNESHPEAGVEHPSEYE